MPTNAELLNPDRALDIILNSVPRLESQQVLLSESLGRILAEDVHAGDDIPPFDNSAMDGYAVIARDTQAASKENPRRLKVVAEQPAGKVITQTVSPGTAIRIMTGAPIPPGADAVVVVEATELQDDEVAVYGEASVGANIRRAGEDVKAGEIVLHRGDRIGPAQMGMLASVGNTQPLVSAKPAVAIIITGDELVDPAAQPGPGQIRNGNQYSLLGQALSAGAEVSMLGHVGDQPNEIEQALKSAAAVSDVVIVCGGVSVGDHDYVKPVLAKLGEILFWRVAIKPGMPLVFGRTDGKPVFGLPGNPVSCMVNFDLFVRPAILRMMGAQDVSHTVVTATVTDEVRHKPGRREFARAVTEWQGGGYSARPISKHGSNMLSSMVQANSYVLVPEDTGEVRAGDSAQVILFP